MQLKVLLISLFCFLLLNGFSQSFFRFKAEITIKVKNKDGIIQYTKGNVCYDKNQKKIIYSISFPEKENYVLVDTLLYKYKDNQMISVQGNPLKPEFSIFHFILSNDLSDFGLKNSSFTMANVEKTDSLVIVKWTPPNDPALPLGKILIATKDKKLQSVLIYDKKGELISRQIFKKYSFVDGIGIPHEILSVGYLSGVKSYQIIEFGKVQINEKDHDSDYEFQVEKTKL